MIIRALKAVARLVGGASKYGVAVIAMLIAADIAFDGELQVVHFIVYGMRCLNSAVGSL